MKYVRLLVLVALAILATGTQVLAAQQNNPYPEYAVARDASAPAVSYSKPNFEKPVFWVRYWNASGYWAENKDCVYPLGKDCFGKARVGESDGVAYDGQILYNPARDVGKYFFRMGGIDRYFKSRQIVDDPRMTNWWMSFALDSAPTIRAAVEAAAMSQKFPDVTDAIIANMVASGVVDSVGVDTLRGDAITSVMVKYTNIALDENVRRTERAIGAARLTRTTFGKLTPGDTIQSFHLYRYGPVPFPTNVYVVVGRMKDGALVTETDGWGKKEKVTWTWKEVAAEKYLKVARATPRKVASNN